MQRWIRKKNRGFFLMIFDDFCHTVIQFNLVVQFTPEESSTKGCESRRVTGFCWTVKQHAFGSKHIKRTWCIGPLAAFDGCVYTYTYTYNILYIYIYTCTWHGFG
jgi:hypothetical protein